MQRLAHQDNVIMRFQNEAEAVTYIFRSMRRRGPTHGPDDVIRDVTPTRRLTAELGLLEQPRQYAVVTGSKGKGSTTVITAKLLQHLGHRVGMMTSPHLVSWRERIRVDGRAIPEADFLRLLGDLAPAIDVIAAALPPSAYFSPQGIFLGLALRWFDEQGVTAAVLEVGRGGRFDDIAVVPNQLSLFTPIMLEHPEQLGPTVERIAWHKAGIIKPRSTAYSVPQAPSVMQVLSAEAEAQEADFSWVASHDMGVVLGQTAAGMQLDLGRYGVTTVSLLGRYQIENAALAIIAAGNMHGRLGGIPHASAEYVARIRAGLADITWPGRCQKLGSAPDVWLDGAINAESAALFLESIRESLRVPVASIVCIPADKDYDGVYKTLAPVSQVLILTETARNPSLRFLPPDAALEAARAHHPAPEYATVLESAVERARALVGEAGTILIVGTQSIVAEAVGLWGLSFEQI